MIKHVCSQVWFSARLQGSGHTPNNVSRPNQKTAHPVEPSRPIKIQWYARRSCSTTRGKNLSWRHQNGYVIEFTLVATRTALKHLGSVGTLLICGNTARDSNVLLRGAAGLRRAANKQSVNIV